MPSRLRSATVALGLTASLALGGCGGSSSGGAPKLPELPLVPGAHVVEQVKQCDSGSAAYCAFELVIQAGGYRTSDDLLLSERHALHDRGWTGAKGPTGPESAADSPGHRMRLTYATASGELDGIDQGWVTRDRRITLALSHAIFEGRATLAMVLEVGAG